MGSSVVLEGIVSSGKLAVAFLCETRISNCRVSLVSDEKRNQRVLILIAPSVVLKTGHPRFVDSKYKGKSG